MLRCAAGVLYGFVFIARYFCLFFGLISLMNWFFVLLVRDVVVSSINWVCRKIPLWVGPLVVHTLLPGSGALLLGESDVLAALLRLPSLSIVLILTSPMSLILL